MRDIITSARLTLRRFIMADAARVCVLVGDWEVARMLARVPYPNAIEDTQSWISKHPSNWAEGTDFAYAITTSQDGVIGAIGIHQSDRLADLAPDAMEIGYWLGRDYWGKGYVTEAAQAVVDSFDDAYPDKALVAGHFTENPQSGHVLEKLGFHYASEPSTIYCLARKQEVPNRSMFRPAKNSISNQERSPTP